MPHEQSTCRIEVLAQVEHCTIGYCRRCNIFHVDLGAVSLKLHALQLHALGGSVSLALDVFKNQILTGKTAPLREAREAVH